MSLRMKTGPKVILALVFGALVMFGLKKGIESGVLPGAKTLAAKVPGLISLPQAEMMKSASNARELTLPSTRPSGKGVKMRANVWAWNSQMGWMYANGGPVTTEGSLMEKYGVNLTFERQDDNDQMMANLVKFAKDYKESKVDPSDIQMIAVMGDGAPTAFLAPLAEKLTKLGPEYRPVIIGSPGYSYGEDKFMGPKEWRDTPYKAKGGVVIGVIRDGDWNIALKWAGDNNIKNNPDLKTYDPDALNWIPAKSYTEAVEKYIAGMPEERAVVKNGKKTGQTVKITGQGVVTWTPGDVTAFQKKPGLVSIADTRMYSWQMANTIITIKKWADDNAQTVAGMLKAIGEGGEQVKSFPKALTFAAKVSDLVYKEQGTGAAYWEKYYKGSEEFDAVAGEKIHLGGSRANNLADMMQLFGLLPGQSESNSIYRSVYTVFGTLAKDQYPNDVPSVPKYEDVVDTRFVKMATADQTVTAEAADKPKYGGDIKKTVSKKAWHINFATGQATFTKGALRELEELYNQLNVTGLSIEIHGHTDNVGSPDKNMTLSERRAMAVKQWLQQKSTDSFPNERFAKVEAHGQSQPLESNDTAAGKAANRRVEIVLGTN